MRFKLPDFFKSDRVALQRYEIEHLVPLVQLFKDNKEMLLRSFPKMTHDLCYADPRDFMIDSISSFEDGHCFQFGVINEERKMIGQIQVTSINFDIPSCEIVCFIHKRYQRQGYASEAVHCILNNLFFMFNFERVFVKVISENEYAIELFKKLGFKQEGVHRKEFSTYNGEAQDVIYLGILKEDFLEVKESLYTPTEQVG